MMKLQENQFFLISLRGPAEHSRSSPTNSLLKSLLKGGIGVSLGYIEERGKGRQIQGVQGEATREKMEYG